MLSSYDIVASVLIAATVVGYGYVTYAALAIRRTIAGNVYRRQAIGLAFVAIFYALNSVSGYYATSGPNIFDIYGLINFLSFPFAFLTIFYWVDTSVLAARLTDPLLRDTLRWSRVRFLIWTVNISATTFSVFYVIYLSVYLSELGVANLNFNPPLFLIAIFVAPAYVSVTSGAAVLLIAVRRTADRTLRRHLEWFGFYLIFIFVLGGLIGVGLGYYSTEWSNLVGGAANAAGAIFLYKSARSLIPLYRFSDEGVREQAPVATSQA